MQPGVAVAAFPQAPGNAIPEQILQRWSWGPFFLSLFWVFWNADNRFKIAVVVIFVCNFIPFLNFLSALAGLALAIFLGLKGNRIMAANRQFTSVDQFVAVQTAWARWGVILLAISVVLGIIAGVLGVFAGIMAGALHAGSANR